MPGSGKRGGVLGAIIVSIVVVAVIAVLAAVSIGVHVARNVRVESAGGDTKIETPFGSLRVRETRGFDPKLAGIPVYPGATQVKHGADKFASLEFDVGDEHKELSVTAAEFTTTDPVDKVSAYYRQHLPDWTLVHRRHGAVELRCGSGDSKRVVAIVEKRSGETHIALASVGEPAAN